MNSKSFNLYIICLIILILDGAHSLFSLVFLPGFRSLLGMMTMLFFVIIYPHKKKLVFSSFVIYLILVLGVIISQRGNVIISFLSRLPILTLLLIRRQDLRIVAQSIDKFFFVIISISCALYIYTNLLGLSLPYERISYNQYDMNNYFYIYTNCFRYGVRFTGCTVEPGYFAVLCICLLALNKFRFTKKSSFVYAIAILFTLSLEGYVLLVTGTIISTICREGHISKTIKYTIITIIILSLCIAVALTYNNGNNVVGEYIMERLVFDKDTGIVGNNRESIAAEMMVDPVFYSDRVWFGIGEEKYLKLVNGLDICSWRSFVLMYGAVYTILLCILSYICLRKTVIRNTITFYIIFWMDFVPHGGPFYEVMYFLMIIFLLNLKRDDLAIKRYSSIYRIKLSNRSIQIKHPTKTGRFPV